MADIFAEGGAGGNGYRLSWTLDFDDVANTVTIDATHARLDGSPASDPQRAEITVQLNSGQAITVDLLTGMMSTGQAFDGTASTMLNTGPRTRTNVKLSVSTSRSKLIAFSTQYKPPA